MTVPLAPLATLFQDTLARRLRGTTLPHADGTRRHRPGAGPRDRRPG